MRVNPRNNLTVELIRSERFGPVDFRQQPNDRVAGAEHHKHPRSALACRADKVELSQEALASDAWGREVSESKPGQSSAAGQGMQGKSVPVDEPTQAQPITPVVGSPALAGLGVALVVPGTLLDVVA